MKWYFCLDDRALISLGEAAIAAAHSALQNTALEPHLIYDGQENPVTRYLETIGVSVHYHHPAFLDRFQNVADWDGTSTQQARARLLYLVFAIPDVEPADECILYTDANVVFVDDPGLESAQPKIAGAAPLWAGPSEAGPKPLDGRMDCGVMVLNIGAFRREVPAMLDCATANGLGSRGDVRADAASDAINAVMKGRWDTLPESANWRPFTKSDKAPAILHFQGAPAQDIARLSCSQVSASEIEAGSGAYFKCNPASYIAAAGAYLRFVSPEAADLLRGNVEGASGALVNAGDFPVYLNDLCSFYFEGKRIVASTFYDKPYLVEFKAILEKYVASRKAPVRILEWGSGFTSLLTAAVLDHTGTPFVIDSLDNYAPYQQSLGKWVYAGKRINWILEELTGPGKSQRDPELTYSTWPLAHDVSYDFIFIDGRRRMECAYVAAIIARPDTIVVIHDFRRGRYQPVLAAFDVIEETEQFRIMRVKPQVHEAFDGEGVRKAIAERQSAPA